MQPSFHTAPTKPEKGTKSNTEKVEKRDGGLEKKHINNEEKREEKKKQ